MIEGHVVKLNSCEILNYIPTYLIWIKDIARYQYTHLFSEKVDTTNSVVLKQFFNEKADITKIYSKKGGDYEFL